MPLPLSAALGPLLVLDSAGSTNDEILQHHADAEEYTAVVTTNQTAGRGRLGRVWVAPPGKTLAVSVLLRPALPAGEPLGVEHYGWLPLIAGVAMAAAVESVIAKHSPDAHRTTLKWPNDVLVDGRKVSGLLAELLPGGRAVVLGAGVNLELSADELPVPTATSLALAGVTLRGDALVDLVLSHYLGELSSLVAAFLRVGGDAGASGILESVSERCSTLGQEVRVVLPGASDLVGVATEIDASGRLLVRRSSDGAVQAVAAGDVTHLRYE